MSNLFMMCLICTSIVVCHMPKRNPILPMAQDIPFIQCNVCEKAAKAIYKQVEAKREEKKSVKIGEEEILVIIEKSCDPDSDQGKWIRHLDIVESKDTLKLEEQSKFGRCKEECQTIARSCEQTIGDIDTDIGEILWQNKLNLSPFINEVCHSLSSVCKKNKQKFVKGKRKDFKFIEMTQQEIDTEKIVGNVKGLPGMEMYSSEELQSMRDDYGIDGEGVESQPQEAHSDKSQQQQQQQHYNTKLGFFDTVKEVGRDLYEKGKRLFGYNKDEL